MVFDFDGVIVDGICEYWWSARRACQNLLHGKCNSEELPEVVPKPFQLLRPWVHHGWEMVLIAAELLRPESSLLLHGPITFSNNYDLHCQQALQAWGWDAFELQQALERVRHEAIHKDRAAWLAKHQSFPGVVRRLKHLKNEGVEWAVLTTKGVSFTAELLKCFHLSPTLLYGHESGSKTKVLLQLAAERALKGFIEDRRSTLETVLATPGLSNLPCYLAKWGYLKPEDLRFVPQGIHLLKLETLSHPLASWP